MKEGRMIEGILKGVGASIWGGIPTVKIGEMIQGDKLHIIVTAQPQPQPNSTLTRVGVEKVISWTTHPTPTT